MHFTLNALNEKECGRRAYFSNLNLGQYNPASTRAKEETITIKNCLVDYLTTGKTFTCDSLDDMLDNSLYYSDWQKKNVVKQYYALMRRFITWMSTSAYECIHGKFTTNISFGDVQTSVAGDMVLRDYVNNTIVMCKIFKNAPELSLSSRASEKNRPYNSFVLAGLYLAGKQMYPNANIQAAFFHLKGKDDTATEIAEEYEIKPGKNIISYTFDEASIARLNEMAQNQTTLISLRNCPDCRRNNKCTECNYFTFCKSMLVKDSILNSEQTVESNTEGERKEVKPTAEQKRVINAKRGLIVVNAAAGCGKTFALTKRIVKLIQDGVLPEKILAITFTNKAADELKERVWKECSNVGIEIDKNKLNINTFNGFGFGIIKEHKRLLGFSEMNIAEKIDLFDIIFKICSNKDLTPLESISICDISNPTLQFMNKKGVVPFLWEYFNRIKVHHWTTTAELETDEKEGAIILTHKQAECILSLFNEFSEELKNRNLVEYQDQINLTLKLFETHPEIKSRYHFDHIMVDEYQDTDSSQVELLKHLLDAKFKSFMVVGDDAQAIYAFRLAEYTNIIKFEEHFGAYGKVRVMKITKNFRSTKEILALGNELNHHHAKDAFVEGKDLVGNKNGEIPRFILSENESVEFYQIKNVIEDAVENKNTKYGEIAIIARTRSELNRMAWFLEESQIPYRIRLSDPLIEDRDVVAIKCIAETLADTDNRFSFLTKLAIKDNFEDLLDLSAEDMIEYVDTKIKSLDFPEDLEERLLFFYDYVDTYLSGSEAAKKMITILKSKDFQNFTELNNYLNEMFDFKDSTSIDDKMDKSNEVTLITAHTAKGKEWKNVIVLSDQFANATRNKNDLSIAEERRLLFVAITRAKETLNIFQYNEKTYNFLKEMGDKVKIFLAKSNGELIENN